MLCLVAADVRRVCAVPSLALWPRGYAVAARFTTCCRTRLPWQRCSQRSRGALHVFYRSEKSTDILKKVGSWYKQWLRLLLCLPGLLEDPTCTLRCCQGAKNVRLRAWYASARVKLVAGAVAAPRCCSGDAAWQLYPSQKNDGRGIEELLRLKRTVEAAAAAAAELEADTAAVVAAEVAAAAGPAEGTLAPKAAEQ